MDAVSRIRFALVGSMIGWTTQTAAMADDNRPCTGACAKAETKTACCCDGADKSTVPKSSDAVAHASSETIAPGSFFVELVSDWLSKSPKFSAQLAIHFDHVDVRSNKVASDLPTVEICMTDVPDEATNTALARPMKFRQTITAAQLGELMSDVIACGHRICTGNKCYDVKDEPVTNTHCDTVQDNAGIQIERDAEDEILVVPMAPPAPPGQDIAIYANPVPTSEAESILRQNGLHALKVQVPVATIVDLLVAKTTLSTRLEMTEQLMQERLAAHEQLFALSERNARLSTQLAVTEARQHYAEAFTVSLIERTELAMKIASDEQKLGRLEPSSTVKAIQEDLSNIRRQIALLKKSQPVPFAPSYVGTPMRPYVPTAQLPVPYSEVEQQAKPAGQDVECGNEQVENPSVGTPAVIAAPTSPK